MGRPEEKKKPKTAIAKKGVKSQLPMLLNEAQKNLVECKTPVKYIKRRQGKGGKKFNYVDIYYVTKQLNDLTGFLWDFEVIDSIREGNDIVVLGKLTLHIADGKKIVKTQYGSQTKQSGVELGDAYKGASSDSLKKCASLFGIAIDVYSGGEIGGEEPEPLIAEPEVKDEKWIKISQLLTELGIPQGNHTSSIRNLNKAKKGWGELEEEVKDGMIVFLEKKVGEEKGDKVVNAEHGDDLKIETLNPQGRMQIEAAVGEMKASWDKLNKALKELYGIDDYQQLQPKFLPDVEKRIRNGDYS